MTLEQEYFTVDEMAKKLRVAPETIRRSIKKGKIQAFRVGPGMRSSYRIPNTELQRLCELDMTKLIDSIVEDKINKRFST